MPKDEATILVALLIVFPEKQAMLFASYSIQR